MEALHGTARRAPSARHARRFRRAWWTGMLLSVLLHVLAFALWRGATPIRSLAGGTAGPALTVAGGGLRAMQARLPAARDIPPPPAPVLDVDTPEIEVSVDPGGDGFELAPLEVASRPGRGAASGPGAGPGGSDGISPSYVSPTPRSILPHWDPPASVRGMEVTVRVHVDAYGRPTGEVELDPPTPDRRFNREIIERVRRMEYRPASRNGIPVAAWAEITFVF